MRPSSSCALNGSPAHAVQSSSAPDGTVSRCVLSTSGASEESRPGIDATRFTSSAPSLAEGTSRAAVRGASSEAQNSAICRVPSSVTLRQAMSRRQYSSSTASIVSYPFPGRRSRGVQPFRRSRFDGLMNGDRAHTDPAVSDLVEPGSTHQRSHRIRVGMRPQRLPEPSVGAIVAAYDAAQQRNDASDIKTEQAAPQTSRRCEIEAGEPSARFQHARQFGEGCRKIRNVAQHEAVHDAVEGVVMKWQTRSIAGHEVHRAGAGARDAARRLDLCGEQHPVTEVRSDYAPRSLADEFEREIAGTGCDIEGDGS